MISLRQIRSVVAVAEEGSFTRAAVRENATQSGLSQHVAAVEAALGVRLFDRTPEGVRPTTAGARYYARALEALRAVEAAAEDARSADGRVSGPVRAGLMPTFTRAVLPAAVETFAEAHPDVTLDMIEAYSGALTGMVRAEELDFALVPAAADTAGLTVDHLVRDRELLVTGPALGLAHGAPIRLADLRPFKLILPGPANVRRGRLLAHLASAGAAPDRVLGMDAMFGTLGLVARSDWVTLLPGLICVPDADGARRRLHPLDPPLASDFVAISPARRPLTRQATLFLAALRAEAEALAQP